MNNLLIILDLRGNSDPTIAAPLKCKWCKGRQD